MTGTLPGIFSATELGKHLWTLCRNCYSCEQLSTACWFGLYTQEMRAESTRAAGFAPGLASLIGHHKCRSLKLESSGSGLIYADVPDPATPSRSGDSFGSGATATAIDTPWSPSDRGTVGRPSLLGNFSPVITSLLAFLSCVVLFLGSIRFSGALEKFKLQQSCNTRGLLTYGNNCSVTYVCQIGRKGAKLHAPKVDISHIKQLELYVAGHQIEARQEWANDYYLGLKFVGSIEPKVMADIVAASRDEDQLSRIEENATECFFPGCHHGCPRHRQTQFSAKQAAERGTS